MADKDGSGNAAFSPAEGMLPGDMQKDATDYVPGGGHNAAPVDADRSAFGGKVGNPTDPNYGNKDEDGWAMAGHMIQPLGPGFSYPSSLTMVRRDGFELNEKNNFDPVQALPPRIKKSDTSGD